MKKVSLVLILTLCILSFNITWADSSHISSEIIQNCDEVYLIEFDKPINLVQVEKFLEDNQLNLLGIQHEYKIKGRTITGGYYFDPLKYTNKKFEEYVKDYENEHNEFIKQRLNRIKNLSKEKYTKEDTKNFRDEYEYYTTTKESVYNWKITKITVNGKIDDVSNFSKDKNIARFSKVSDLISLKEKSITDFANESEKISISSIVPEPEDQENRPIETWIPADGYLLTSIVPNTNETERTIYLDFKWDSDYNLSGFHKPGDNNEALEMDVWFLNDNDQAFMYYIEFAYWSSDQPQAYLDTQYSDDWNPRVFCVGCPDAQLFTKNTTYYWYIKGTDGTNFDRYAPGGPTAVCPQRGERIPEDRYDEWGVFASQTEANNPPIGYSTFSSPGCKSW